jgi:hypothetical protein
MPIDAMARSGPTLPVIMLPVIMLPVIMLLVFMAALLGSAGLAAAGVGGYGVGDYEVTDTSKVYYGNHRLFQRPATISCDRVYERIPEYQEIIRRGLTDKDPQYHLLMKKATARFGAAVKKTAQAKNHDLVACVGSVRKVRKKAADIPDRTDDVIQSLD